MIFKTDSKKPVSTKTKIVPTLIYFCLLLLPYPVDKKKTDNSRYLPKE